MSGALVDRPAVQFVCPISRIVVGVGAHQIGIGPDSHVRGNYISLPSA